MSDNPVEAAANELKKWLEQLKKIKDLLDSMEKAKIAEQKAIGDKALEAHKEMVQKSEWTELRKQQAEALKMAKESNEKLKDLEKAAPSNNPDVKNTLADADQTIQAADQDVTNSVSQDQGQGQGDLNSPTVDDAGVDFDDLDVDDGNQLNATREGPGDLEVTTELEESPPLDIKVGDTGLDSVGDVGAPGSGLAQGLQKGVEGLEKGIEAVGAEAKVEGAGSGWQAAKPAKAGSVRESLEKEGYDLKRGESSSIKVDLSQKAPTIGLGKL